MSTLVTCLGSIAIDKVKLLKIKAGRLVKTQLCVIGGEIGRIFRNILVALLPWSRDSCFSIVSTAITST